MYVRYVSHTHILAAVYRLVSHCLNFVRVTVVALRYHLRRKMTSDQTKRSSSFSVSFFTDRSRMRAAVRWHESNGSRHAENATPDVKYPNSALRNRSCNDRRYMYS